MSESTFIDKLNTDQGNVCCRKYTEYMLAKQWQYNWLESYYVKEELMQTFVVTWT